MSTLSTTCKGRAHKVDVALQIDGHGGKKIPQYHKCFYLSATFGYKPKNPLLRLFCFI